MWNISAIWVAILEKMQDTHVELIPEFPWQKHQTKILSASQSDLYLMKEISKFFAWSIALYGAKTRTLRKVDQKCHESFEKWYWRRVENNSVRELFYRVREKKSYI
jgi:hypothetical protein